MTELLSRTRPAPADAPTAELATAVMAAADRFLTDMRRDCGSSVSEIEIVYPDALDER